MAMVIRATTHDVRQYYSLLQCLILESCTHPHSHTHTYTSINGLYHHRRYCKKGRKKEKSSSLCRVMLSHLWFAHPSHRYLLPCASFFLGAFARVPRPSLFSLSLSLSFSFSRSFARTSESWIIYAFEGAVAPSFFLSFLLTSTRVIFFPLVEAPLLLGLLPLPSRVLLDFGINFWYFVFPSISKRCEL